MIAWAGVDRMRNGLANQQIVEGRLSVVGGKDGFALGRSDDDRETRIGLELRDCLGGGGNSGRPARRRQAEAAGRGCRIGDEAESRLVERDGITPVIGVPDDGQSGSLGPVFELERAGADRLFLVGLGRFRRDDHRVAPSQVPEECPRGLLQRDLDGQVVDGLDIVYRGEETLLGIDGVVGAGAVERKDHIACVEVGAIVEFHAVMQLERIGQAVFRQAPALGQAPARRLRWNRCA